MIIIDIPTWMLWVGWLITNTCLLALTFLILIVCLNKVDKLTERKN